MRDLQEKLKVQTQRELQGQMEESKKRKQEELGADKETPAEIPVTETDSEFENFLSNTVNSDMSSGEDPTDQHSSTNRAKGLAGLLTNPWALLHLLLIKSIDP